MTHNLNKDSITMIGSAWRGDACNTEQCQTNCINRRTGSSWLTLPPPWSPQLVSRPHTGHWTPGAVARAQNVINWIPLLI